MSFFVAARKDTKAVLEIGQRSPDITGVVYDAFLAALAANHKVEAANISLFVVGDDDEDAKRMRAGEEYSFVWTNGEITGVDFSIEDAKRWLKVSVDKTEIEANGTDVVNISLEIWRADKSGIATSVNAAVNIPVLLPDGERMVRVQFVNGVASRAFTTTRGGVYVIPSRNRFPNGRVMQQASVTAFVNFSDI